MLPRLVNLVVNLGSRIFWPTDSDGRIFNDCLKYLGHPPKGIPVLRLVYWKGGMSGGKCPVSTWSGIVRRQN